jgi:spore coat protein A, manganese oxidase
MGEIMKLNRRQFLKNAALAGAGIALTSTLDYRSAIPFSQSPITIRKFVTGLPGLTKAGANNIGQYIPLATKHTLPFAGKKTDLYNLVVSKFSEKMHPDLPGKTKFFGYADLFTLDQKYLAAPIVATRNTPVLLTVTNLMPNKHILPVDPTLMAGMDNNGNLLTVGDLPLNRLVTHLHGGLTPWFSDGTPYQWFTPKGQHGPSFKNVPGTINVPGTATYYYTNQQSARMVWYHDHAIGLTRLNAYAGIASAYIITDDMEAYLLKQKLLPDLVGIPLVLQDKTFWDGPNGSDPTYAQKVPGATPGDLWYPWEYEANVFLNGTINPKGRVDYGPTVVPPSVGVITPLPPIACVPEFFADTAMVNGAPYPELRVKSNNAIGNTFRFRMLNASQARFWHLNLYQENPAGSGEVATALLANGKPDLSGAIPGPEMYQFGTEGGFLPAVVTHNNTTPIPFDPLDPTGNTALPDGPFNLLLGPAERAEILIDFSSIADGTSFILYNDAPGPFPGGDPRNDYFTGDPDYSNPANNFDALGGGAPTTLALHGPNTRTIMKIVVDNVNGAAGGPFPSLAALNAALAANYTKKGIAGVVSGQQPPLLAPFNSITGQFEIPPGTPIRNITLNEDFDEFGRLLQRAGTDVLNGKNNQGLPTYGRGYADDITEVVTAGAIEAWDFYNTTMDVHPWHMHLVNFQVVGRGIFNTIMGANSVMLPDFGNFTDLAGNLGKLTPPDPNEQGWKETIRMNPMEVTRIIMKFDLPVLPAAMGNPLSPRTGNHEYVHHCHILEHEEHDMMRTLVVKKV